ncbi:MAG TPA: carboxypeptidase-like regulatory domain-containing protein, partial [Thermoanaerobaculia bacterium]|nr:carboxypeptidase-like regulatory domain-containing protein [Thermoanaerobaculia bacterium]
LAAWDEQFVYLTEFHANVPKASLATAVAVTSGVTLGGHRFTLEVGARVSGTAKHSDTGAALTGITISAYRPTGELLVQTRSGTSGEFTMVVPPGKVRLVAHDDSGVYAGSFYRDAEAFVLATEFDLLRGASLSGIDFRLAKGGTIAGLVTDATTGARLTGVAVAVYNLSGTTRSVVYTSATGEYSVLLLPGSYKVAAYDLPALYAPQFWSKRAVFQYADTAVVVAERTTTADFAMFAPARLTGTVSDKDTAGPIAGVIVTAFDAAGIATGQAVSDSLGAYTLVLPPGTYKLLASDTTGRYATGYENGATSLESAPWRTVSSGQLVSGVGFQLKRVGQTRRRPAVRASSGGTAGSAAKVSAKAAEPRSEFDIPWKHPQRK